MDIETDIDYKEYLDPIFLALGQEVYLHNYVDTLRSDKKMKDKAIVPYRGSQEMALSCSSDLLFYVGLRGVGKSAVLCMGAYDSIEHPAFSGMILRREINDAKDTGSIADVSKTFFNQFGTFKSSAQNMRWDYNAGGSLKFGYYSDSYDDFVDRVRGKNLSYIGIDEVTQMKFKYFKFLFSNNRNSNGLKNQIVCTCNPDGDSWVYKFVGRTYMPNKDGIARYKWLDEHGNPIPEMNGKELYFFAYGDREDQIYWGETREEVVSQGRDEMLRLCTQGTLDLINSGESSLEELYVLSCTFVTGYTIENQSIDIKDYNKRLAMMTVEERERDLGGKWLRKTNSSTLIDMDDMDRFYANSYQNDKDGRYVTADISLGGKETSDPTTFFLWEGFHIAAVETCKLGDESLKAFIDQLLTRWGIAEQDFCFDATGIGGGICERYADSMQCDYRTKAFDTREIQVGKLKQNVSSYENVKAQCIDNYARRMKNSGYSIQHDLLYTKFDNKMLIDHFNEEYVSIARDYSKDSKFKAIDKSQAISMIGHSPDYMDAKWLREYIELCKDNNKKKIKRSGLCFL